jgi:hypothetical protein
MQETWMTGGRLPLRPKVGGKVHAVSSHDDLCADGEKAARSSTGG